MQTFLAASTVVPGMGLLISGGKSYPLYETIGTVELFNGTDWSVLDVTHEPVALHCLAAYNDHMVILSGGNKDGEISNCFVLLRLDTGETLTLNSMNYACYRHDCAITEHGYVVAGGLDSNHELSGVEYYRFPDLTQMGFLEAAGIPCQTFPKGIIFM